eukprot:TRINITY_DN5488_c0_g2_i1.p1 TRINITY_DN5488_c0_g2~~TRINITY_DN5488_c0_g2_i1.p1  ORF type:complete len:1223 (-),score=325.92 TRINITY_DN5488_c0_g2_i1:449-4117(-)
MQNYPTKQQIAVCARLTDTLVGALCKTRKLKKKTIKNAYIGSELVSWLVVNTVVTTREEASNLIQSYLDVGLLLCASGSEKFLDDPMSCYVLTKDFQGEVEKVFRNYQVNLFSKKIDSVLSTDSPTTTKEMKKSKIGRHSMKIESNKLFVPTVLPSMYGNYGSPLENLVPDINDDDSLPIIVKSSVIYLEKHGIDVVGIFRVEPDNAELTRWKQLINYEDKEIDFELFMFKTPHLVSALLKAFFRELPVPILHPFESFSALIPDEQIRSPSKKQIHACRELIEKLPNCFYRCLKYLIGFLRRIADNHTVNLMTTSNISSIFGPNLMWRKLESSMNTLIYLQDVKIANAMVMLLIENFETIFMNQKGSYEVPEGSVLPGYSNQVYNEPKRIVNLSIPSKYQDKTFTSKSDSALRESKSSSIYSPPVPLSMSSLATFVPESITDEKPIFNHHVQPPPTVESNSLVSSSTPLSSSVSASTSSSATTTTSKPKTPNNNASRKLQRKKPNKELIESTFESIKLKPLYTSMLEKQSGLKFFSKNIDGKMFKHVIKGGDMVEWLERKTDLSKEKCIQCYQKFIESGYISLVNSSSSSSSSTAAATATSTTTSTTLSTTTDKKMENGRLFTQQFFEQELFYFPLFKEEEVNVTEVVERRSSYNRLSVSSGAVLRTSQTLNSRSQPAPTVSQQQTFIESSSITIISEVQQPTKPSAQSKIVRPHVPLVFSGASSLIVPSSSSSSSSNGVLSNTLGNSKKVDTTNDTQNDKVTNKKYNTAPLNVVPAVSVVKAADEVSTKKSKSHLSKSYTQKFTVERDNEFKILEEDETRLYIQQQQQQQSSLTEKRILEHKVKSHSVRQLTNTGVSSANHQHQQQLQLGPFSARETTHTRAKPRTIPTKELQSINVANNQPLVKNINMNMKNANNTNSLAYPSGENGLVFNNNNNIPVFSANKIGQNSIYKFQQFDSSSTSDSPTHELLKLKIKRTSNEQQNDKIIKIASSPDFFSSTKSNNYQNNLNVPIFPTVNSDPSTPKLVSPTSSTSSSSSSSSSSSQLPYLYRDTSFLTTCSFNPSSERLFQATIGKLFKQTSTLSWILLGYESDNQLILQASDFGNLHTVLPHLKNQEIQYIFVRLPPGNKNNNITRGVGGGQQQQPSSSVSQEQTKNRDVFIVWIGPNVEKSQKILKGRHVGEVAKMLKPFDAELTAVSKLNFTENMVRQLSDPDSDCHVID